MNIYVGNLARKTTRREIRDIFAEYGKVSQVLILKEKESGLPRGIGLVRMKQDKEGKTAIAKLNGILLGNQILKVREAKLRPRQDRSSSTSLKNNEVIHR